MSALPVRTEALTTTLVTPRLSVVFQFEQFAATGGGHLNDCEAHTDTLQLRQLIDALFRSQLVTLHLI